MLKFSVAAFCALVGTSVASAQRGAGDWMTSGNDAQRSSWVRSDSKISPDSMRKPGFELLWKLKSKNAPRQLNNLTPPVLIDFYIGYKGFRSLAFFGGSSSNITAVDVDVARIEWDKNVGPVSNAPAASPLCPGGMTSGLTRPTTNAYPPPPAGRGFGRGSPASSGVGAPFEGAVTLKKAPAPPPPPPPTAAAAAAAAALPNPFARSVQYVHALSADGKFHSLYLSNGEEPNAPVSFLAPNANAHGLIVFNKTAYVATTNKCGGVENGVWALKLESGMVTNWKTGGAGIAGSAGPAAGPDGTLYAATTAGELVALEESTLKPKTSYKAGNGFTSSPVVFDFGGKTLIALAAKDELHLLNTAALTGNSPLAKAPASLDAAGALASWQDSEGTRWVLAAAAGNIVSFKVVEQNGGPALRQGWVSREMVSPLAPIVINGVVFALSSGEFRSNDTKVTTAQIAQRSSPAILYALDSATGKEIWNSGAAIASFAHSGGLAAGGSRVYVSDFQGTQYAFGFPIEH